MKIIKEYSSDERGNIALMFGLIMVLMIVAIGVAIDYSMMSKTKSELQSFADSAVLSAAVSDEDNPKKLQEIAEESVASNNLTGLNLTTELTILENNSLRVDVSTKSDLMILSAFGYKEYDLLGRAEAPAKGVPPLNIAFALDATQSMDGAKEAALKAAAKDLVDELASDDDQVQFSVIPFAEYVKLPKSYENELWLNIAPDAEHCWQALDEDASSNCTTTWDGEEKVVTCDNKVMKEVCAFSEWDGCVGSRQAPHHLSADVNGFPIQGFTAGDWCHSWVQPLTSNKDDVKSAIDDMGAAQHTYIPVGLVWAWRSLTPRAPMIEAATPDINERISALILMSDGENTTSVQSPGTSNTDPIYEGRFHWNSDIDDANNVTATLCNNIKAEGINIYTIAYEVTDTTTVNMLRSCASSNSHFYSADDAAQLKSSFETIGKKLSQVRLSR